MSLRNQGDGERYWQRGERRNDQRPREWGNVHRRSSTGCV